MKPWKDRQEFYVFMALVCFEAFCLLWVVGIVLRAVTR